jgi:hypothetical protein
MEAFLDECFGHRPDYFAEMTVQNSGLDEFRELFRMHQEGDPRPQEPEEVVVVADKKINEIN